MYNSAPAADIEVKLCETFVMFVGCKGKIYTTKTDENGEYLFKNVEPMVYESLLVKVFKTTDSIYASNRFGLTAAKYRIEPDETFFAPPSHIYKFDMKGQSPKQGAKIDAKDLEIKWNPYENAKYYKVSMYSKNPKVGAPFTGEEVEGESYKVDKDLTNGDYRVTIEAYNANDSKLAQLDKDLEFTVTGGKEPPAEENKK